MKQLIGHFCVDAGLCWIGDPCYIMGSDASHKVNDWHEFCETLSKKGQHDGKGFSEPLGNGVGFAVNTGYGDGAYPVFIEKNGDGRVERITIEFMSEDDYYDDYEDNEDRY